MEEIIGQLGATQTPQFQLIIQKIEEKYQEMALKLYNFEKEKESKKQWFNTDHTDLKSQLDEEIREHQSSITKHKMIVSRLESQIRDLSDKLRKSSDHQCPNPDLERLNIECEGRLKTQDLWRWLANKLHEVQKEKQGIANEVSKCKTQIKDLKSEIKSLNLKHKGYEEEKIRLQENNALVNKTNSKLNKTVKEQALSIAELQKELVSKTQRLEIFRNFKSNIETKSKVLVQKVSNLEQTQFLVTQLQAENEDLSLNNRELRVKNAQLSNQIQQMQRVPCSNSYWELMHKEMKQSSLVQQIEPE